jgi:uncharacterized membrane protein (UPF0127 family)
MRRLPEVTLAVLLLFGCKPSDRSAAPVRRYTIEVGAARASVEVAATPDERQRGLSGRKTLGADEGMLFIFPRAGKASFWMKDTHVPLSIAFITPSGEIAEIRDMAPLDETPHVSAADVLMALEMPEGWFDSNGVNVGDAVTLGEELAGLEGL